MLKFLLLLFLLGYLQLTKTASISSTEDAAFWRLVGENYLKRILSFPDSIKSIKAKNVIIFIGDGMGVTSITAGRIYKGQKSGRTGEEASLVFDNFPNIGLSKTYSVDKQVPDSASTATALFCGIKTNQGVISMDKTTKPTDAHKGKLTSIMDWALSVGKRTGFVTTTRISHATPAALYANAHHRSFECDSALPEESIGIYKDISRQLVEDSPGKRLNVILGGGKSVMGASEYEKEPEYKFTGPSEDVCERTDGRNLTEEWLKLPGDRKLALSRDDLFRIDTKSTDHLMGIFMNNHMSFSIARNKKQEPSLVEMTDKALDVLIREDSKGFVLVIEGGRIDQAHHQNHARAALNELYEMDQAIELALNRINISETIIIVTADHSHAMTLNGYPTRGNDILGFANKVKDLPYETLTYANGPGFYYHRLNKSQEETGAYGTWKKVEQINETERSSPLYRHLATFPLDDETHGGEDIPVYAIGPGANLIRGVFEQNYISYVVSYAACFGPAMYLNENCFDREMNLYDIVINSSGRSIRTSHTIFSIIFIYYLNYLFL